jgi:hypothetical protein
LPFFPAAACFSLAGLLASLLGSPGILHDF